MRFFYNMSHLVNNEKFFYKLVLGPLNTRLEWADEYEYWVGEFVIEYLNENGRRLMGFSSLRTFSIGIHFSECRKVTAGRSSRLMAQFIRILITSSRTIFASSTLPCYHCVL